MISVSLVSVGSDIFKYFHKGKKHNLQKLLKTEVKKSKFNKVQLPFSLTNLFFICSFTACAMGIYEPNKKKPIINFNGLTTFFSSLCITAHNHKGDKHKLMEYINNHKIQYLRCFFDGTHTYIYFFYLSF